MNGRDAAHNSVRNLLWSRRICQLTANYHRPEDSVSERGVIHLNFSSRLQTSWNIKHLFRVFTSLNLQTLNKNNYYFLSNK